MLYDFVPQFVGAQDQLGEGVTDLCSGTLSPSSANVYTSYSEVFASTPFDAYGITVESLINNGASRQTLFASLEVGTGGAGSETLLIENMNPGNVRTGDRAEPAFSNYFPLYIPAGTRIAVRGAMSNATSATIYYRITLNRITSHPFNSWFGRTVTAYGSDRTNLKATVSLTPGGSPTPDTWGSWTEITASTTRRHKALILQIYPGSLATPPDYLGMSYQLAIGGSGSEHIISHVYRHTQNPEVGWFPYLRPIQETVIYKDIPAGSRLSARALYGSYGTSYVAGAVSVYGIS